MGSPLVADTAPVPADGQRHSSTPFSAVSLTGRLRRGQATSLLAFVVLAEALFAAVGLRLAFVLPASFPLNDGGLFYTMARDIQDSGFLLPAETSYNGGLPFTYPPLGIYTVAAIDLAGPWSLLDVMRLFPLAVSVLSVFAFALLAHEVLRGRVLVASLATLFFALLPMSYVWVIMGGGVTRSVGQLFSLLALWQAVRLARRPSRKAVFALGAFAALTALAHPEAAWFVAYSTVFVLLALNRSRVGFRRFLAAGAFGIALAAPWLGLMVARHGFGVLHPFEDSGWPWYAGLVRLAHFDVTREPFFPLLGALALFGAIRMVVRGDWFLAGWVLLAHMVQPRAADQRAVVPIAMLAAVGIVELVALESLSKPSAANGSRSGIASTANEAKASIAALVAVPVVLFVAFTTLEAYRPLLSGIPASELQAMRLTAAKTPPDATFVVVTGDRWFGSDRTTEWFPAITHRQAANVVQGYEWTGSFSERMQRHEALQACATQGIDCVEMWARIAGTTFEFLYIAKRPFVVGGLLVDGTGPLQTFVRADPRYLVLYDGPGALVARRLSAPQLP